MVSQESLHILAGRIETLDSKQELALKQVWANFLLHWGYKLDAKHILEATEPDNGDSADSIGSSSTGSGKKSWFGLKANRSSPHHTNSSSNSSSSSSAQKNRDRSSSLMSSRSAGAIEASYPHSYIHESLKKIDANQVKNSFWGFLRADYPDNLILRFLRARKWDTDKCLAMISGTIHWRLKEQHPDALIEKGEKDVFVNETEKAGLKKNIKLRKAVIRNSDLNGRPIVFVRPKLHYSSDQTEAEMEDYSLIVIEQARLFLKEPYVDQATIFFDLTGFSTSNMDYAPVKFLIKCFEAHYPECLGKLIIHKAPWIFSPIWNIVKNWLDPVVASKVVFTKNLKDVGKIISPANIPEYLGGEDDHDFDKFPIESVEEWETLDSKLKDFETRDAIKKERNIIIEKFIQSTINWIESDNKKDSEKYLQEKIEISKKLSENYIKLDPYIRSRSHYDINGTLKL